MSQVNLNTVILYKGDAEHRPIDTELPLEGIDKLFPKVDFPRKGITFLYGHRNPAIPYLLKYASIGKLDAAIVDVHVEIGKWLRQKVDLTDGEECGLRHTRFLSVVRAKRDIVDLLSDHWERRLKAEGLPLEDWPRKPTMRPFLLDEVVALDDFKHLAVIAYTVESPEVGEFQVATVFDLNAIALCDGGSLLQDVDLVL